MQLSAHKFILAVDSPIGMEMRGLPTQRQRGVVLLVAMVALLILTAIGLSVMGDLLIQSGTVRNEQLKQRVFYAVASEVNANINTVNRNSFNDDDPLILSLLNNPAGSDLYVLSQPPMASAPVTVLVNDVQFFASKNNLLGCMGESIGKVKVLSGTIEASGRLNDDKLNKGTRSKQRQRFIYCWP